MPHILLVEDEEALARNLQLFLEGEAYTVTHARGQREAMQAFAGGVPPLARCLPMAAEPPKVGGAFDCVLLDVSLADGNGFAVCAAIKASSDVPVIFLTASADEECTVAGFEVGADDYISKPFRPRELLARIKNVMRRQSSHETLLQCGNVRIDPARGLVTKNGSEVFLSALEYRLLLLFFSNKGILLTRERLADELWTISGEFVCDNTLNVYIKRLRDKIEDDPQKPTVLKTVRGLGYKAVDA